MSAPLIKPDGTPLILSGHDLADRLVFRALINEKRTTAASTGYTLTNLTNNRVRDASPAWSPDGTRIAFASERDGNLEIYSRDIYVMNANGSGLVRLTNGLAGSGPAWQP